MLWMIGGVWPLIATETTLCLQTRHWEEDFHFCKEIPDYPIRKNKQLLLYLRSETFNKLHINITQDETQYNNSLVWDHSADRESKNQTEKGTGSWNTSSPSPARHWSCNPALLALGIRLLQMHCQTILTAVKVKVKRLENKKECRNGQQQLAQYTIQLMQL